MDFTRVSANGAVRGLIGVILVVPALGAIAGIVATVLLERDARRADADHRRLTSSGSTKPDSTSPGSTSPVGARSVDDVIDLRQNNDPMIGHVEELNYR